MSRIHQLAAALALGGLVQASASSAADELTVGMITTLSGPGAGLGIDIRDGFALAVEHLDGKFGDFDAKVIEADDQQKPDVAVQLAERMLSRDGADIVTGTIWSNLALAMLPAVARAEKIYISPNAGPSQLAGSRVQPALLQHRLPERRRARGDRQGGRRRPGSSGSGCWRPTIPPGRTRCAASAAPTTRRAARSSTRSTPSSASSTTPPRSPRSRRPSPRRSTSSTPAAWGSPSSSNGPRPASATRSSSTPRRSRSARTSCRRSATRRSASRTPPTGRPTSRPGSTRASSRTSPPSTAALPSLFAAQGYDTALFIDAAAQGRRQHGRPTR